MSMRGFLTKQGGSKGGKKNWKRRWFVLVDATLTYYASKTSSKPKGYMDVADCDVSISTAREFCISVRTVQRELLVSADTEQDMNSWMDALKIVAASAIRDDEPAAPGHRRVSTEVFGVASDTTHAAIPEVEGDAKDAGLLRMPGTSMFWDIATEKPVFLPTVSTLKHVRAVRFPDYLDCANHKDVVSMMRSHGDSKILFSDFVIKVNRDKKVQRRVFLLTDLAVYTLHDVTFQSRRRMRLEDVGGVSYSNLGDEFLVIHIPSHYDYLLSSTRKGDIVKQITKGYEAAFRRSLPTRVYGGDQPMCEGWRWMEQVWEESSLTGTIVSGSSSTLHKVASRSTMFKFSDSQAPPLESRTLRLAQDQLTSIMNSGVHPLGTVVRDYIKRFQAKNAAIEGETSDAELTEVIQSMHKFFEHVQHDVSRVLISSACNCAPDDALAALHTVTFPKIYPTVMGLFNKMHASENAEILCKMRALQGNPVALMRFLGINEGLFLVPPEAIPVRASIAGRTSVASGGGGGGGYGGGGGERMSMAGSVGGASERMSTASDRRSMVGGSVDRRSTVKFRVEGDGEETVVVTSYEDSRVTDGDADAIAADVVASLVDGVLNDSLTSAGRLQDDVDLAAAHFAKEGTSDTATVSENNEGEVGAGGGGGGGEEAGKKPTRDLPHRDVLRKLSVGQGPLTRVDRVPYASAAAVLKEMPSLETPTKKATCLEQTVRTIFRCVDTYYDDKGNKPIIGADDMLPLIVFVVVYSELPNLLSEANFLAEFMQTDKGGEAVYCVRTFEIAASFLQTLDATMVQLAKG